MLSLRSLLSLVAVVLACSSLTSAQTNLITNGGFELGSLSGWTTPLGVNDTTIGGTNNLRAFSDGTATGPNGWAYEGIYSALWESSSLNQSIVQSVAVTGGTQYILSFYVDFADGDNTAYLQVSAQFNDGSSPVVLLTPNGDGGAQQSFCSGSQKSQPPFWWSQFTFTITAPSAASSVALTFYGYDSEYGFLVDGISMYTASGNSAPAAPPALPVTPSGNLLVNGDFETGSLQPWRETAGDNPYGLSGQTYSGEGAYDFVAYANSSGIACPSNNYCFTFGAALAPLPIQTQLSVPSGTSANYSLTWTWYSLGGYNVSNPSDAGSQFSVSYAWGSNSLTTLWAVYNSTTDTSSAPQTVTVYLGVPPSGTTTLTLQMAGYFYATYYTIDNIQLMASGVTQAQSAPIYTCAGTAPGSNGAAQSYTTGAVTIVAALLAAVMLLL